MAYSLGVAVGTVKSRLTRARQALRLELREARAREGAHVRGDEKAAASRFTTKAAGRRADRRGRPSRMVQRMRGGRSPKCGSCGRRSEAPRAMPRSPPKRATAAGGHRQPRPRGAHGRRCGVRVHAMLDDMHLVYAGAGAAVRRAVLRRSARPRCSRSGRGRCQDRIGTRCRSSGRVLGAGGAQRRFSPGWSIPGGRQRIPVFMIRAVITREGTR